MNATLKQTGRPVLRKRTNTAKVKSIARSVFPAEIEIEKPRYVQNLIPVFLDSEKPFLRGNLIAIKQTSSIKLDHKSRYYLMRKKDQKEIGFVTFCEVDNICLLTHVATKIVFDVDINELLEVTDVYDVLFYINNKSSKK